ncbi:hypothetical protein [Curtobacterium sp. PhB136]|uniref:hypothetical protein n=1 Tax=Curtobacterium sp. PhB136 TaxID=2485181 RepID=UPI00104E0B6E|nr:hypothetical protein [Curtobacterium sp. PhB136]TCK61357.1 hypothetical protein EDF27_3070 [Curtobacterium sp. PhB136]
MLEIHTRWSRSSARFSLPLAPDTVKDRLVAAAEDIRGMRVRYVTARRVVLMSSPSWTTWGDLITVELDAQEDGGTSVEVRTAPSLRLSFSDWGQGAKDIHLIHEALTSHQLPR